MALAQKNVARHLRQNSRAEQSDTGIRFHEMQTLCERICLDENIRLMTM